MMKSEFIPFIVIGSIFAANYLEDYYIEKTKEYISVPVPVMVHTRQAIKKKPAKVRETFSHMGMSYAFGNPHYQSCIGVTAMSDTCAERGRKFMIVPFAVRNDTDTSAFVYDEFALMVDGHIQYEHVSARNSLLMTGELDGVVRPIRPSMQASASVVFEVSQYNNQALRKKIMALKPVVDLK